MVSSALGPSSLSPMTSISGRDRVLDQRLQQQAWYLRLVQFAGHVDADREPRTKADPLDVDVHLDEFDLVGERGHRLPSGLERASQERAQSRNHSVRRIRIAVHQRGNGVQCIEQKMWLQLHRQGGQSRFGQLRRQTGIVQLTGILRACTQHQSIHDEHEQRQRDAFTQSPDEEHRAAFIPVQRRGDRQETRFCQQVVELQLHHGGDHGEDRAHGKREHQSPSLAAPPATSGRNRPMGETCPPTPRPPHAHQRWPPSPTPAPPTQKAHLPSTRPLASAGG